MKGMAIRIRIIDGYCIALCAAITEEKEGDLYLNDDIHHALSTKFWLDFRSEGIVLSEACEDLELTARMVQEQGGRLV